MGIFLLHYRKCFLISLYILDIYKRQQTLHQMFTYAKIMYDMNYFFLRSNIIMLLKHSFHSLYAKRYAKTCYFVCWIMTLKQNTSSEVRDGDCTNGTQKLCKNQNCCSYSRFFSLLPTQRARFCKATEMFNSNNLLSNFEMTHLILLNVYNTIYKKFPIM